MHSAPSLLMRSSFPPTHQSGHVGWNAAWSSGRARRSKCLPPMSSSILPPRVSLGASWPLQIVSKPFETFYVPRASDKAFRLVCGTMEHVRETWTDERLDDLNHRVD